MKINFLTFASDPHQVGGQFRSIRCKIYFRIEIS